MLHFLLQGDMRERKERRLLGQNGLGYGMAEEYGGGNFTLRKRG